MADPLVKEKLRIFNRFARLAGTHSAGIIAGFAVLTFISSWAGAFPSRLVESWYARIFFPKISYLAGRFSDAVPFSWVDAGAPLALALLVAAVRGRRFRLVVGAIAGLYLFFFWSWGLNYHRQPLASKLTFDAERAKPEGIERFTRHAAGEINRLYIGKQRQPDNGERIRAEAVRRVERVVGVLDGSKWRAPERIKNSWIANAWFHVAGIDGVFNPFGHEPIINNTLLDVELPFIAAHELAHVRGYPNEGDANLIAVFATVMSEDSEFQYSGWLNLWLYLRTRQLDALLDDGPRRDLQRIFERARAEQIRWISNVQTAILDWFLKANRVEEGVRSYSQVVLLAAGTEDAWSRFR